MSAAGGIVGSKIRVAVEVVLGISRGVLVDATGIWGGVSLAIGSTSVLPVEETKMPQIQRWMHGVSKEALTQKSAAEK